MYTTTVLLGSGSHGWLINSTDASGAPVTLADSPSLALRTGAGSTQTAGLTLTVDVGGITGLHLVTLDVDDATLALADGDELDVYLAAGTVGGTSVVGAVVGHIAVTDGSLATQTLADIHGEVDTAISDASLATAAGLAALNDLSSAEAQAAVAAALAAYSAATDSDVTTAVGALNDLSSADVQTAAAAALTAYDPPTNAELTAALAALNDPTTAAIASAVWSSVIESAGGTDYSAEQLFRGVVAILLAKASGLPTAPVFRDLADSKDRVSATTDANGNRSAVTLADLD